MYTKARKARTNGKTLRKNPKFRSMPMAAKSGMPPLVVDILPSEATIITTTSGMAPIRFEAINGITAPVKYLQNAFFPLKGAVRNKSLPPTGAEAGSFISISEKQLKF
jgi:hypothetical protein